MNNFMSTVKKHPWVIGGAVILGALWVFYHFVKGSGGGGAPVQGSYPGQIDPNVLAANTMLQQSQIAANVQNAQTGAAVAINQSNNSTAASMQENDIQGALASQRSGQRFRTNMGAIEASLALNNNAINQYLGVLGVGGGNAPDSSGGMNLGGGPGGALMASHVNQFSSPWGSSTISGSGPTFPPMAASYENLYWFNPDDPNYTSGVGTPFDITTRAGYTPPTGYDAQNLIDWLVTGGGVRPTTPMPIHPISSKGTPQGRDQGAPFSFAGGNLSFT